MFLLSYVQVADVLTISDVSSNVWERLSTSNLYFNFIKAFKMSVEVRKLLALELCGIDRPTVLQGKLKKAILHFQLVLDIVPVPDFIWAGASSTGSLIRLLFQLLKLLFNNLIGGGGEWPTSTCNLKLANSTRSSHRSYRMSLGSFPETTDRREMYVCWLLVCVHHWYRRSDSLFASLKK